MKLTPDQKAGLYITAIVHLAVIIILLLCQIGYSVQRENSFVLDFTKQEEQEKIEKQEELSRNALAQLESMLSVARSQPVRNVTVNRSQLKDDRNTDADQLYRDAERLAQDLKDGQHRQQDDPEDYVQDPVTPPSDPKPRKQQTYSGPSVLSWSLDGRKSRRWLLVRRRLPPQFRHARRPPEQIQRVLNRPRPSDGDDYLSVYRAVGKLISASPAGAFPSARNRPHSGGRCRRSTRL